MDNTPENHENYENTQMLSELIAWLENYIIQTRQSSKVHHDCE